MLPSGHERSKHAPLSNLDIPYITLLDLDTARYGGGWGRVRYAASQLLKHPTASVAETETGLDQSDVNAKPAWDDPAQLILSSDLGRKWLARLESCGVYFSAPLDLDFSMLTAYPGAYHLEDGNVAEPTQDTLTAVLGKGRKLVAEQYSAEQDSLFAEHHRMFNNGSKPVQHLSALSNLSNEELFAALPAPMSPLISAVKSRLAELPE